MPGALEGLKVLDFSTLLPGPYATMCLADYDVVVEQFRPGVMAKFKLDYESLRAVNPAVIYCSIAGYG